MIFRKYLVGGAILAMLGTSTPALAAGKPWKTSAPRGMTTQHQQYAAAARQVHAQVGAARFGYNPLQSNWRYEGDRNPTTPLSNMTQASLTAAITGRYHVYSEIGQSDWSVRYFGTNGMTYFCESNGRGKYSEFAMKRYEETAAYGLSGWMHWDKPSIPPAQERVGWPTIANPETGEFYTYGWYRGDWLPEQGWLQSEYAAAFAENCPQLPRTSQVNNNQRGRTLSEMAQGARALRGFNVAFPNDPRDPLTAGMYYHLYPPTR